MNSDAVDHHSQHTTENQAPSQNHGTTKPVSAQLLKTSGGKVKTWNEEEATPNCPTQESTKQHELIEIQTAENESCLEFLYQLLQEAGPVDLSDQFLQFRHAPLEPPITKQSLTELEITHIVSNLKLRHDISFDRDLHFRPNMDGLRGKAKLDKHRRYWIAITLEVELLLIPSNSVVQLAKSIGLSHRIVVHTILQRLPKMFETIKEILRHLLPERDLPQVDLLLEVEILIQEIGNGVCNFVGISECLGRLLKTHCAPMRDTMIDGMVNLMRNGDSKSISASLCELFAVLESMKLDVANHQIRHLRALLIQDTINFERKYHGGRITRKRLKIDGSREWYQTACQAFPAQSRQQMTSTTKTMPKATEGFQIFVHGFIELILDWVRSPLDSDFKLPKTFFLDADRIRLIRLEILQEIQLQICLDIFQGCSGKETRQKPRFPRCAEILKSKLRIIAYGGGGTLPAVPNIAVAIVDQIRQLSDDLTTPLDLGLIEEITHYLRKRLQPYPSNERFGKIWNELRLQLNYEVLATSAKYMSTSVWDMFNGLVPPSSSNLMLPPPPPPPPVLPALPPTSIPLSTKAMSFAAQNPYTEVTNKIAHIAVLHWRIWAPLVYQPFVETSSDTDIGDG